MSEQFAKKVALVTGAGSGIGEACAKTLAVRGAQVVVADIDMNSAERVVKEITEAGGAATATASDVADPASVEALVQFVTRTYGGLDVAVNNAGIGGELNPAGSYSVEGGTASFE